jgi:hypothetical protein
LHDEKPKFGRFETWGACSRCGARVKYSTLARERLTGLLVCTPSSGRPVKPCLDPWPPVYDFQVTPDRSIEPPPEPLPARWGLDDIWSAKLGVKVAIDDKARLQALMIPPNNNRNSASFVSYQRALNQSQDRTTVTYINSANYDGTFVPSNSVRTVEPPETFEFPWMTRSG